MSKTNNNKIVEQIGQINFQGNIVPMTWFKHIKTEAGKPDSIGIMLLSEIIYWYRPSIIRDEHTGEVLGWKKKFNADKLQKSYDQLAEQFGYSKTQVRRAIKRMEDQGLITTEFRHITTKSGLHLSNVMYLEPVPEKIREITYDMNEVIDELHDDEVCRDVWTNLSISLDKNVDTLPTNLSTAPNKNVDTYTETTTKSTLPKTTTDKTIVSSGKKDAIPYDDIVSSYNEICTSLPSVRVLSDKRRDKIRTCYKKVGNIDEFIEVFEKAEASDFLSGRNGVWASCNFDWLINYNNFVKVLEGTYDNKGGGKDGRGQQKPDDGLGQYADIGISI